MKRRILTVLVTGWLLLCMAAPAAAESTPAFFVERQVYQYLTEELEMNSAAACGVLANIEHESAFNLTIVGDYGTSFGLCQWHNGRYAALINFCGAQGLDYRTVEGQMRYLAYELKTGYYSVLASLRHVENSPEGAYRAGYLWCTQFERPANAEQRGVDRGTTAQYKYWNRYNAGAAVSVPSISVSDLLPVTLDAPTAEEPTWEPAPAPTVQNAEAPEEPTRETTAAAEPSPMNPAPTEAAPQNTPAPHDTQRRITIRPFPVRRHTAQARPVQPDRSTGFAVGFCLLPMGDGMKRKIEVSAAQEEPVSA